MRSHIDEPSDVTVRCNDDRGVGIRLGDAVHPDDDAGATHHAAAGRLVNYAVELHAPGMTARLDRVVGWTGEARELDAFLTDVARDFGGWDGARRWHTDDRDFAVSAVFRSGGRVELTWTLRPCRAADGTWTASVTTVLEAGEQMAALAADVRHFLSG
ncbi:DUF6228 family protein [Embleya sp. NBC_00896]|uniref:DUF6228 family protein n=1 Tax=Embleya sp. NBC_00896 TaxID=2975961 RepID=UPI0038686522|nr:DUF6228 family protein [Embleya sp. NBC_00896]